LPDVQDCLQSEGPTQATSGNEKISPQGFDANVLGVLGTPILKGGPVFVSKTLPGLPDPFPEYPEQYRFPQDNLFVSRKSNRQGDLILSEIRELPGLVGR